MHQLADGQAVGLWRESCDVSAMLQCVERDESCDAMLQCVVCEKLCRVVSWCECSPMMMTYL